MAFLVHMFRHEHETMIFGLCRVKLRLTCCEAGKWQTLQKPSDVQYSGQVEGLAKLARWGFGGLSSAMKASKGEVGWQFGCESGPRWAQEGPRGPKMAQDRPKMRSKGATGDIGPTRGGGSGPPRGSKILNRKLGESEAECDPKSKRRSAEDLTRR